MNIKQAKEQIKNAMIAYFTKDEFGNYKIPIEAQRPIFLMGPPGVGKTAIMEQVASELNVGLISYSMTHHTRQSALGLPYIATKTYCGKEYQVSEYTMSEIIASIYEVMENTGTKEGILFLDEINCVSETLAPSMLQFLQYKIFGTHKVPEGWIVVTAGNPPEYNNSVHDFDIVTWDRLKRIDVEPNYDVWKEYAYKRGIHASIITYLDTVKQDFYKIETTVDGKSFVTARGWSDLSDMIKLYEENNLVVDEKLISQYLQDKTIAINFSVYYDLFNKYKSDYQINDILLGKVDDEIKERAKSAKFDERFSLIGLILDALTNEFSEIYFADKVHHKFVNSLKEIKIALAKDQNIHAFIANQLSEIDNQIANGKKAASLSSEEEKILRLLKNKLSGINNVLIENDYITKDDINKLINKHYAEETQQLKNAVKTCQDKTTCAFEFLEEVFGEGEEILIFVTEMTINYYSSNFISKYGCEKYFEHNKDLLFYERQKDIVSDLDSLDL